MNTESGNNDSGISGSVSDEPRDKPVLPRHGNVIHKFRGGKQVANYVRKMNAMLEEEDIASDDTESNVIRIGGHRKHSENDCAEWSSEERGHLLNSAVRRVIVAPTVGTDNVVRRTIASRDYDSPESVVRNNSHRWPRSRPLMIDQAECGSSSGRDNGIPQSPGGLSLRSIDHPYLVRHHHCVNARSPRISNPVMDESQQRCITCYHQSSPTWSSNLYAEFNGSHQVPRSFPDTISIKSLTSIGLGSSDGRKLTIRRVPTSPSELLNVVHPPP